jgi:DNA-binding response OmpR family regulator
LSTILIIDDDDQLRRSFERLLTEEGYTILSAPSGEAGLKLLRSQIPDLAILDMRLPGMNGLRLTRKIKKDSPGITIGVLTSHDLPEYREAAIESGADRFFAKSSFKWDEVEALVKSISPGVP